MDVACFGPLVLETGICAALFVRIASKMIVLTLHIIAIRAKMSRKSNSAILPESCHITNPTITDMNMRSTDRRTDPTSTQTMPRRWLFQSGRKPTSTKNHPIYAGTNQMLA